MSSNKKHIYFSTYSQMIHNLASKGLEIDNRKISCEILKSRGYYNLIKRYNHEFYIEGTNEYQPHTNIMDLYFFHRMKMI